ncbi:hypothetical protein QL285_064571 [Trifolium repens]|nr:hypothetical protein QL285_064571 [Trifolium repens]
MLTFDGTLFDQSNFNAASECLSIAFTSIRLCCASYAEQTEKKNSRFGIHFCLSLLLLFGRTCSNSAYNSLFVSASVSLSASVKSSFHEHEPLVEF